MLETIIQVLIVVLSGAAVWLVSRKEPWSKYGFIVGVLSQPLWFYTTIKNEQWGLFALSCFYLYSWGTGVYNNFLRKEN